VELYLHSPNTPSWRGAQFRKKAQGQPYEGQGKAYTILVGQPERKETTLEFWAQMGG
jgi:hypothetical protein